MLFKREVRNRHQHLLKFGIPFIITTMSNISYDELYTEVITKINRFFAVPASKFLKDLFVIKITDKNGVQEPRVIEEDTRFQNMDTLVLIFSEMNFFQYFSGPQFLVTEHNSQN